jgi:anaerobic selenocysteine-containing dehydrogenase
MTNYLHRDGEKYYMNIEIRTSCARCLAGCGMYVSVADGTPVSVRGDPESKINEGVLCERGKASIEYMKSEHRLTTPLMRAGKRGANAWKAISWKEALQHIAISLNKIKELNGPESVAFVIGGSKGVNDVWIHRFANVFGSPNITKAAQHCYLPTFIGSKATYGGLARSDYENNDELVIIWGLNKQDTALPEAVRIDKARKNGARLVVIDPTPTYLAKKADTWLQPIPGTDLALALGMIHTILSEELYDSSFVKAHTKGFDALAAHIRDMDAEWAEQVTGIRATEIRALARDYAGASKGSIASGNGIEHSINNVQCARALAILRSITGKLCKKGCDTFWDFDPSLLIGTPAVLAAAALGAEQKAKSLNAGHGLLPMMPFTLHQLLTRAMREGEPYPIRAAVVMGSNPLHTWPNSTDVYQAFDSLDLLVVADYFLTPTAALADIVLPAATYMEIDSLIVGEYVPETRVIRKTGSVGDCWSDCKIFVELAKHMNMDYGWKTEQEALDAILDQIGMTFEELKSRGSVGTSMGYGELLQKIATPSGKIELYSSLLEKSGHDPLPSYREPWGASHKIRYPLILTNWKRSPFVHSGNRQIPRLRSHHPEPIALIHTDTAKRYGIANGEWCSISTETGSMVHKAKVVDDIRPDIVIAEHGWWFPEEGQPLHTWLRSNINALTSNGEVRGKELGTAMLRGVPCTVSPVPKPPYRHGS